MREPVKTPFVEFVERYTDLNWKGTCWMGCCPIHDELTPSFAIYPNKGEASEKWICFACSPQAKNAIELINKLDPAFDFDSLSASFLRNALLTKGTTNTEVSLQYVVSRIKAIRNEQGYTYAEALSKELDAALKQNNTDQIRTLLS